MDTTLRGARIKTDAKKTSSLVAVIPLPAQNQSFQTRCHGDQTG
ncbi:hypothetical protein Agau_L101237 [Agrobacterium tumefaciens F2]|nr:hypothetical protein Agau_L101237 [Agrobacterium tumefaciens F2]